MLNSRNVFEDNRRVRFELPVEGVVCWGKTANPNKLAVKTQRLTVVLPLSDPLEC